MTLLLAIWTFLMIFEMVKGQNETITAIIYADNRFDFYVDGTLIKSDPIDFTPHNAVKFTFTSSYFKLDCQLFCDSFSRSNQARQNPCTCFAAAPSPSKQESRSQVSINVFEILFNRQFNYFCCHYAK